MASVQTIKSIKEHPDADRLSLAEVGGFQAVIQKEMFSEGEKVLYIEPDNVLPTDQDWAQPYLKYAANRIRAIKIRGEWSEGLVVKLAELGQERLRSIQSELDEKYLSVFQPEVRNAIKVMHLGLLKSRLSEHGVLIQGKYASDKGVINIHDLLFECVKLWTNCRIDTYFTCINKDEGEEVLPKIDALFDKYTNSDGDLEGADLENAWLNIYGFDVESFRKVQKETHFWLSGPGRSVGNGIHHFIPQWREHCRILKDGFEMSSYLGVVHYDPPVVDVSGESGAEGAVSQLPYGIPKTDETRWEKCRRMVFPLVVDVTLKVDGQSCSFYYHLGDDKFGILGRRLEFDSDVVNNYTAHVARYDLEKKLRDYCQKEKVSLCLRGESYGEGIQKSGNNPHSKVEKGWALFSVWIIDATDEDGSRVKNQYARKGNPYYFLNVAQALELPTVDIVERDVEINNCQAFYRKYAIEMTQINGQPFEGVVIQWENGSCKIINKPYDSKK